MIEIRQMPAARWDIWECAAWIERRTLSWIGSAYDLAPSRPTIEEINRAWRAGEIAPSGEVDGAVRRVLTPEDARDYSILLIAGDSTFGGVEQVEAALRAGELHLSAHHVFPNLYPPNRRLCEDGALIVVMSFRVYPEQLVHDRYGAIILNPDGVQRMRHRFIMGILFDRESVIAKWPARSEDQREILDSDDEIFERTGFRQIAQIVEECDLDLGLFDGHPTQFMSDVNVQWNEHAKRGEALFSIIEGPGPRERLLGQCKRFLAHFRSSGIRKISIKSAR
jgi:hypothetical protein